MALRITTLLAAILLMSGCAITQQGANLHESVTTVDSANALAASSIKVGKDNVSLAVSPTGKRIYVTANAANTLTVVNTLDRSIARVIDGGEFEEPLGGCPHNFCKGRGAAGVAIGPGGKFAYVSSMKADAVSKTDLATGRIVASAKVERFPRRLQLSSSGDRLYAFNSVANTISVINTHDMTTVGEPLSLQGGDASNQPFGRYLGMWLAPSGDRLYVYNAHTGNIVRFDTQNPGVTKAFNIKHSFQTLGTTPDNSRVALADKQGISIVDGETMAQQKRLNYCAGYYSRISYPTMALDPSGRYLAFHARRANTTWVLDLKTGEPIRKLRVPDSGDHSVYVYDLAFSADGGTLYQLDADDRLTFFDLSTSLPIGDNANGRMGVCTPKGPGNENNG